MKQGTTLISRERERQQFERHQNGKVVYDAASDDTHYSGELALIAKNLLHVYALECVNNSPHNEEHIYEWSEGATKRIQDKHTDPIKRLTIAGALIAAEIDRLQRLATPEAEKAVGVKQLPADGRCTVCGHAVMRRNGQYSWECDECGEFYTER